MKSFIIFFALIVLCAAQNYEKPLDAKLQHKAYDFVKGLLEGINEHGDIQKLLSCITTIDNLIDDIIRGLRLIATKKTENVIVGLTIVVKALYDLMKELEPCTDGLIQVQKLIIALKNLDIKTIIFKFLENPGPYIADVIGAVEDFRNNDFYNGAKKFGNFLFLLFLSEKSTETSPAFNIKAVLDILDGFFIALNRNSDLVDFSECTSQFPVIYQYYTNLIISIREMKWNDLHSIIYGLSTLVNALRSVVDSCIPCSSIIPDIKNVWNKISSIDLQHLAAKLQASIFDIIHDVTKAVDSFKLGKFRETGTKLGDLAFIIFLMP